MGSFGERVVRGLHDSTNSIDLDIESIPQAQVVEEEASIEPTTRFVLPLGNSLRIYSVGKKWVEIQLLYCFAVAINADFSITMAKVNFDSVEVAEPDGHARWSFAGIRGSLSRKTKFSSAVSLLGGGIGSFYPATCGPLAGAVVAGASMYILLDGLDNCGPTWAKNLTYDGIDDMAKYEEAQWKLEKLEAARNVNNQEIERLKGEIKEVEAKIGSSKHEGIVEATLADLAALHEELRLREAIRGLEAEYRVNTDEKSTCEARRRKSLDLKFWIEQLRNEVNNHHLKVAGYEFEEEVQKNAQLEVKIEEGNKPRIVLRRRTKKVNQEK